MAARERETFGRKLHSYLYYTDGVPGSCLNGAPTTVMSTFKYKETVQIRVYCLRDPQQLIGMVQKDKNGEYKIGFWCRRCGKHIFFALEELIKGLIFTHDCSIEGLDK